MSASTHAAILEVITDATLKFGWMNPLYKCFFLTSSVTSGLIYEVRNLVAPRHSRSFPATAQPLILPSASRSPVPVVNHSVRHCSSVDASSVFSDTLIAGIPR